MNSLTTFKFQAFDVRVVGNDPLNPLFVAYDVASALGYKKPENAIARHCKRQSTTPKQGGGFLTLIPESDLYRLVFRSTLKSAEIFTNWIVEDVIPAIRKTGRYEKPENESEPPKRRAKALPGGLLLEQQDVIKQLIASRIEPMPSERRAKAAITCWSALKSKFKVNTYKEIPPEQFTEAVSLVARLPLEGEYIEAQKNKGELPISFTVEDWINNNPHGFKNAERDPDGFVRIPTEALYGMDCHSPLFDLLRVLTEEGYEVEACYLEAAALKHHLEMFVNTLEQMQTRLESRRGNAFVSRARTRSPKKLLDS